MAHGYIAMEGTQTGVKSRNQKAKRATSQDPREIELLCLGNYVFGNFCKLALAPSLLGNDFCSFQV